MEISAVILTKNEEKNIERCLGSLDFCDEIIIIDDYSTDSTIKKVERILKDYKSFRIYQRKIREDFSEQRNFGLKKSKNEWVLFIDGDEEVSIELKKEIKEIFKVKNSVLDEEKIGAFYIKRRDFWWGRELKYGEIRKIKNKGLIRLVRKGCGKWVGKVHEEFKILNLEFKIQSLKNYLNHYPHPQLKEFIQEINFYTSLRAKELFFKGKKTNIWEIIFYPLGKFILNYFIYLGFLDGPPGFAYAFLMSFHSFLVRVKLFQFQLNNKLTNNSYQ